MAGEINITETREETVQRLIGYHQRTPTKISDYNPGSETRNLMETMGWTVNDLLYLIDYLLRMGYVHTAEGYYLDMIGILVDCKRKQAVQSTGSVIISVDDAKDYDVDIPAGTILFCSRNPELEFQTTTDATFQAGNISILIEHVLAVNGGIEGNVAPGLIDSFFEGMEDLTVTNTVQFTDGRDVESDFQFRPRILEAAKGLKTGSVSWYKTVAGSVQGVHDIGVRNDTDPINETDIILYVNGVIKPTPESVIDAVIALFEDEDHTIGGVSVRAMCPQFYTQNIVATITLRSGFIWSEVKQQLEHDIAVYFNGGTTSYGIEYPGLNHEEAIIRSAIQLIMANNPGVLDYNLTTPPTNNPLAQGYAAKLGTITLTQAV